MHLVGLSLIRDLVVGLMPKCKATAQRGLYPAGYRPGKCKGVGFVGQRAAARGLSRAGNDPNPTRKSEGISGSW